MALSIRQAQAKFLSEGGFIGGQLRTDPGELSDVEKVLSEYIKTFLDKAASNLNATNSITTGALEKSLSFDVVSDRNGITVNFTALDYYKFVDKGVRGVKGGVNSTSPYKFKFITPSKSHIEAIRQWIKNNNLTALVSDINKYGGTRRERKGLNTPEQKAAYIVARSIKKKGLKATNFWQDAFDDTFGDFGQKMSAALGKTVTVNLQQMAEEVKSKKGLKL